MKIGTEDNQDDKATLLGRWGVPLSVAVGVTAVSVAAVTVLGGTGDAEPRAADPARGGSSPQSAASASPTPSAAAGSASGGAGSTRPSAGAASDPDAFTVTDTRTTPIDAGTAAEILSSCLGADASRYHAVAAVRAPVAAQDWDGVVVAVDSAGQYAQCQAKGDKGSSQDSPPTFINDRLWGAGRIIEYFDSGSEPVGKGRYLMLGAGHYTSAVARITVSYGGRPKEYPAVMAGGAFVYAAAFSPDSPPGPRYAGPSPFIHAYDASGKEIYDQTKDSRFTGGE